jgi:hypothetical protein
VSWTARFRVSELEAEYRLVEFETATGMTPLACCAIQDEALERGRIRAGSLLDEVLVVAV